MGGNAQRAVYGALWVLGLAFGWIEASVVVYLREISVVGASLPATDFARLQVTLTSLPAHLVALEMAREASTILLLGASAWMAGPRPAERAGAFLLLFGVWDLTYYAVLELVSGWPESLRTWDVLFLIPIPWVAPVWAPMAVASIFVFAGTHLLWTPEREREYRRVDVGILAVAGLSILAAFMAESRAAIDHRIPDRFPVWLFCAGVGLATGWFLRIERRAARQRASRGRADLTEQPERVFH